MKISLSPEQRSFAQVSLPFLLSGTAGSGKTTIVIHKLLEMDPNTSKLYVTYTKDLCKEAKQMFHRLVKGMDEEEMYIKNVHFKTFDELMRERQQDKVQDVITRERFLLEYKKLARKNNLEKDFPALMMWEEVRGVWKGGLHGKDYPLTEKEYLDLTNDQAPNFVGNRKEAYAQFERYQKMLEESFKVDEQDLLYESIKYNNVTYDYVFCDEVQDLSMLHIRLLYELTGENATNLFLTGDDQQILHHSGFRWANIKDLFTHHFNHKPPTLEHLKMNYRSVGAITDLAMSINNLEKKYTSKKIKAKPSQSLHYGEKPFYFSGFSPNEMINSVHNFGPHQAIIVRSEEQKDELRSIFQKQYGHRPLIFTIFEIKGLEFERILMWDFFPTDSDEMEFWNTTTRKISLGKEEEFKADPKFQRVLANETNLLYVAVTRGSHYCYVFDGEDSTSFWKLPTINDKLQVHDNLSVFKASNPTEDKSADVDWFKEGIRLLDKKLYEQALDCFNRLEPSEKINKKKNICLGFITKKEENYTEAINHFKEAGLHEEVIACLDILEEFKEAETYIKKNVIRSLKDPEEIDHWNETSYQYKVKEFDRIEKWTGSGIYCKRLHQYYEAAIRFERASDWILARDAYDRALKTCDPTETKRLNLLQEKYNKVAMKLAN
nr:UvrD-helicase domain-containing protein [Aquibacillus halophilus]